ncbi:OsmC family protein [Granulicella paludicola]|jgi:organic hydroperoxide reductase OsmC/OhrA|uniref:OsmC family protein n=1 Tax=Granulicella paludicola TaxID=474951 RepID=UPI0021DF86B8|nr:OsmC family protein [Granulicella paludicola]
MSNKHHQYNTSIEWTGNRGKGTSGYRLYERSYDLGSGGKPMLQGSADATFRGDASKWNPEDMLLAALSSCHMLSYLHCCADAGISVISYTDAAGGTMELASDGSGHFTQVVLHPQVTITRASSIALAQELHHKAHELCFIANSVNFPVRCEATVAHAVAGKEANHA